ncbi:methyltransferase, partial [Candidatus Woesearchaeota archaeon]|nr:methyltransferase [Candidatus Woesearchaeota archaeon]
MKGAIITHPGLEAVSGKEVKELIKREPALSRSVAVFETEDMDDICTLCYRSQSAMKVLLLFCSGKAKKLDAAAAMVKKLDIAAWLKDAKFCVRAMIVDNDMFDHMETERELGEVIYEKYNAKVDLENPDVTFFAYVHGDDFYFGVDFAGFDLSKRNYKIFALADSIKATVAYSLVRLSGYKPGTTFLDPFCHSGVVAIEAAFYASGKPINFYNKDRFAFLKFPVFKDKDFDAFFKRHDGKIADVKGITASDSQQRHLRAAEKNAKIAGLNKQIAFSRMDIEWLDTKFEKQSIERIVSNPPKISRLLTEKGLEKMFQELFYTADFILKKTGRIVILTKNYKQILNHATRHQFALTA